MTSTDLILAPKDVKPTDFVVFGNGRVERGKRIPFSFDSAKNVYGQIIRFKQIPLATTKKIDGKLSIIPKTDPNGNVLLYGKEIDFTRGSLRLNPITHYFVLKELRDLNMTVSSKKSPELRNIKGWKAPKNGWIVESEPEYHEQLLMEQESMYMDAMEVLNKISKIEENLWTQRMIAALKDYPEHKGKFVSKMKGWLEQQIKNIAEFNNLFEKEANGDLIGKGGKVTLKPSVINRSLIKLAIRTGVINYRDGIYFFGDKTMGTNQESLFSSNPEKMAAIRQAVEMKYKERGA